MTSDNDRKPLDFFDRTMTEPECCAFAAGEACVISIGCPGSDGPNEDSATLIPVNAESGVLIVADGMGGASSGHLASRAASQAMQTAIASMANEDLLRTGMINGMEQANAAVRELAAGAGTTMVAVELCDESVRPYNIGDSAILVVGGRGKVKYKSIPHSPTGYAVESGLLNESEAIQHEERHLVSNVIGVKDMRIDIGPVVRLAPRDTVLLASDGLADNLMPDEIAALARLHPLSRAVRQLAEKAAHRMIQAEPGLPSKPDDLTILAYRPTRRPKSTLSG